MTAITQSSACTDDALTQRVTEALWSHPWLVPADIAVRVENGCLRVSGQVMSEMEMTCLNEVLDEAFLGQTVDNQVAVRSVPLAQAA